MEAIHIFPKLPDQEMANSPFITYWPLHEVRCDGGLSSGSSHSHGARWSFSCLKTNEKKDMAFFNENKWLQKAKGCKNTHFLAFNLD